MTASPTPTISVITCFLNVEEFIEEAIESVLRQEYRHWELLLVDDGSSDSSTTIAKRYASQYPDKVVYCEHEGHVNKGLSASRNLGIKQSRGELISFLDADDVWQPNLLLQLLQAMQQQKVPLVCEATEYWYNWDDPTKQNKVIEIGTQQDRLYLPPQLMLNLYPLGKGAAPCMCGVLVTKEALLKHGGFEDAFTGMYEDQIFLSKFYLNEPIYISSKHSNLYRQRQNSLVGSSKRKSVYHEVRTRYLKWLKAYMQQENIHHASVEKLLKKALFPYRFPYYYYATNTLPVKGKKIMKAILSKVKRAV